jgi:ATP-binding cassette subfamily B multidrug efflux pump
LGLFRLEGRRYSLGILALLAVDIADVLAPLCIAVAIDLARAQLSGGPAETVSILAAFGLRSEDFSLISAVGAFLGLQLAANAFRYPMLVNVAGPSHRLGQRLRNGLVDKLLSLSRPFYDRTKSGDLMSLGTADVTAARMMLGPAVLTGVDAIFLFVLVLALMFALSWKLALVAMIPLPFIAFFTNKLSHAEYQRFEAVQEDLAKLTERARETYGGIRVLQAYAREPYARERFAAASLDHFRLNLRLAQVKSVFEPTLDLMLGVAHALVLGFGAVAVARGELTLGTFVAFLFLVGNLSGPMIGFGWAVSLVQRGRASLSRLDALAAEPVEIYDAPGAVAADGPGHIRVRGLRFAFANAPVEGAASAGVALDAERETVIAAPDHPAPQPLPGEPADERAPGEPILDGVDLDLQPGKRLGVIGRIGAGKSVLTQLLVRLYEPPAGAITIDGRDVRDLTLASLRRLIAVVPQDTFLFSDTVRRNVCLAPESEAGDPLPPLRAARVEAEVTALPKGIDSLLGERGVDLSGGQRQRVAIARALAADPRVLVLDDCLSAVDAETEAAILAAFEEALADRSAIIVSHRVIALQRCDEIVVLEHGRVAERGTHDELIALGGRYAEIARDQMMAEA